MSSDSVDAESQVSGNQTTIPAYIRRQCGIEHGDCLQWTLRDDGTLHVEVVHQREETFADFEGYDGTASTDVGNDNDAWGLK